MITLKVTLNDKFARSVREQDHNLQEVIQLIEAGNGQTRIVSSMIGWRNGPEWDKTYDFFSRGNAWTYRQLLRAIH